MIHFIAYGKMCDVIPLSNVVSPSAIQHLLNNWFKSKILPHFIAKIKRLIYFYRKPFRREKQFGFILSWNLSNPVLFLKSNKCQYNTRCWDSIGRLSQVHNKQYTFSDPAGKANSKSGLV
jgi:hypothetical protein